MNFYRKYYRPGMISLVFLPILLIPIFMQYFSDKDMRMIRLNIPERCSKHSHNKGEIRFCIREDRKYSHLKFIESSDLINIEKHIKIFKEQLSDSSFIKSKPINYVFGYNFKIPPNSDYEYLVKVLNLFEKYGIKRKALNLEKDEFVFSDIIIPQGEGFDVVIYEYPSISYFENINLQFKKFISEISNSKIPQIIIGYFSFLIAALFFWKLKK